MVQLNISKISELVVGNNSSNTDVTLGKQISLLSRNSPHCQLPVLGWSCSCKYPLFVLCNKNTQITTLRDRKDQATKPSSLSQALCASLGQEIELLAIVDSHHSSFINYLLVWRKILRKTKPKWHIFIIKDWKGKREQLFLLRPGNPQFTND